MQANDSDRLKTDDILPPVIVIVSSGELLRDLLLQAHDLGMSDGEYAFLSIELIKTRDTVSQSSWYRTGDVRNKDAREMFESLLQIAVRVPTSSLYSKFVHEVIQRSHISAEGSTRTTVTDVDVSTTTLLDASDCDFSSPVPSTLLAISVFVYFVSLSFGR